MLVGGAADSRVRASAKLKPSYVRAARRGERRLWFVGTGFPGPVWDPATHAGGAAGLDVAGIEPSIPFARGISPPSGEGAARATPPS